MAPVTLRERDRARRVDRVQVRSRDDGQLPDDVDARRPSGGPRFGSGRQVDTRRPLTSARFFPMSARASGPGENPKCRTERFATIRAGSGKPGRSFPPRSSGEWPAMVAGSPQPKSGARCRKLAFSFRKSCSADGWLFNPGSSVGDWRRYPDDLAEMTADELADLLNRAGRRARGRKAAD